MAACAGLFFSGNDPDRQTLHRRITPTDAQQETQEIRWNTLAEFLLGDLRDRSGCSTESWLQGSYKFGTQIRPAQKGDEFDIDLGVYFSWEGEAESGPHTPQSLREMVQSGLSVFAETGEGVKKVTEPPKTRCCRIHYEGDFHIDVPSYHLDPNSDDRTLACDHGWEVSDPRKLYEWWKDNVNEARRPKARRYVRYVKCWAALIFAENARPSSVLITVMIAEALALLDDDQIASDDEALRDILEIISTRLTADAKVRNPVNWDEDLNRLNGDARSGFTTAVDGFFETAEVACEEESEAIAAIHWSRPFKHFFPMPTEVLEEVVKFAEGLPVPSLNPDVDIVAVPRNNQNLRYTGRNKIGPIPKDCDITFSLVEPWNLPSGTIIEWIVRNEGVEAETENDLGHLAGTGPVRIETSAYRGTHYMDCVLRRAGVVAGLRRIPVQITGVAAPRRNPTQRPSYIRLRGKR